MKTFGFGVLMCMAFVSGYLWAATIALELSRLFGGWLDLSQFTWWIL